MYAIEWRNRMAQYDGAIRTPPEGGVLDRRESDQESGLLIARIQ